MSKQRVCETCGMPLPVGYQSLIGSCQPCIDDAIEALKSGWEAPKLNAPEEMVEEEPINTKTI